MALWALAAGSVVSGLLGARSASKAADASADAARQSAEVQERLGNRSMDMQENQLRLAFDLNFPQWDSGIRNNAARDYALGTGAHPSQVRYAYPSYGGGSAYGGGSSYSGAPIIEHRASSKSTRTAPTALGGLLGAVADWNLGQRGQTAEEYFGGSPTTWSVGDKSFDSREAAEAFVQSQTQNQQPQMSSQAPYRGYGPMKGFYEGLESEHDRGVAALNQKNFLASPDYQFRQSEGADAIGNYFASRGLRNSGAAGKASGRFASNLAAGEWGDWWNRSYGTLQDNLGMKERGYVNWLNQLNGGAAQLGGASSALTAAGQNSANASTNILGNMASGMGAAYQNAGDAKAGGIAGRNSAYQSAGQNIMDMFMMNKMGVFNGV